MSSSSPLVTFSRPCPKNEYYDIFLSFRGSDTRYGFTNNLYRSLRENELYTFMDENLMGEKVENLFEIIEKSRMAVVIYSENFASSDWCLKELEMIMKRKQEKKMMLTPILYKIDVHELKHLSEKTGKYLDEHISKYGEDTVKNWKNAIINFGEFNGLSYKDIHGRYESDFILDVIAKIKEKLEEYEKTQESCILECLKVEIKLERTRYGEVTCVDLHRTKPWVLLTCPDRKTVSIWNYKSLTEVRSLEVKFKKTFFSFLEASPSIYMRVCYAKFIPEKHWIVVADSYGFVHVFDHDTSEELKVFKAHKDYINCMVVHPTSPYVLTASDDKLIKLWNWETAWTCIEKFKGHTSCVMQVAFNPKDYNSFASVSTDGTIKVWSFGSPGANFTIETFAKRLDPVDLVRLNWMNIYISRPMSCVEYFVGNDNKLYLLSGSVDLSIKVWDYKSRNVVQTLVGYSDNVTSTLVHPDLPIIITGSDDSTMRIWNKVTYKLELEWKCDFKSVWSIEFIKASNEVVIGCSDGMLLLKIVNAGIQSD